jgi:hypothetical protein
MKGIPNAVSAKFGRQLLHLQKASPQLMFAAGVVGVVGSGVLACRATLRLDEVFTRAESLKVAAHVLHSDEEQTDYDDKRYAKDLTIIKVKTILDITKLYGPAIGLGAISVALLTGSHVTLNKRNASLAAAYASVDQAFEQYRGRVKDQLGDDADREFRYGTRTDSETVDTGDGKKKVVKHTRYDEKAGPSQYARFFDQTCSPFKRNPEYNAVFLKAQQSYFNNLLTAQGHVFLNEVYDALGIPRSQAGAVVGWVLGKGGDDYIDFGIFDDKNNPHVRDFVNGHEDAILLDFNVDGVVFDKI